jgi:hypothetical protein
LEPPCPPERDELALPILIAAETGQISSLGR